MGGAEERQGREAGELSLATPQIDNSLIQDLSLMDDKRLNTYRVARKLRATTYFRSRTNSDGPCCVIQWMQWFVASVDLRKPVGHDDDKRPRWTISYSKCLTLKATKVRTDDECISEWSVISSEVLFPFWSARRQLEYQCFDGAPKVLGLWGGHSKRSSWINPGQVTACHVHCFRRSSDSPEIYRLYPRPIGLFFSSIIMFSRCSCCADRPTSQRKNDFCCLRPRI